MPTISKPSRSDVLLDMIEHDIEREGFVRTKRNLSLAYRVAEERAGKRPEKQNVKREKPVAKITRRAFEIGKEATLSIL